jgi:hypothetical protein
MLAKSAIAVRGPGNGVGAGLVQAQPAVQMALDFRPAAAQAQAAPHAGPQTTAWTTTPLVAPVSHALAAIASDPTAAGDFFAQVETGGLDAAYQPETQGMFALVQNATADVVLLDPSLAHHG